MKKNSAVSVLKLPTNPDDLSVKLDFEGFSVSFSEDKEENSSVFEALLYLSERILSISDIERVGQSLIKFDTTGRLIFCSVAKKSYSEAFDSLEEWFDDLAKNPIQAITHLSILQIAAKYGMKTQKRTKNLSYLFAREFLSYQYEFFYNLPKQIITYKERSTSKYKDLDDRDLNSIYQKILMEESIKISVNDLEIILFSDFVREVDPIADYFEKLPPHDGYDYIGELASTIIPELNFAAIWPVYLKKWLLGLVAGVIRDADINQSALILHGEQGVGKSRWIRRLVPDELVDYYFAGKISANNKDSKLFAYQNLIVNLDELDFPERKEINSLKSLITQKITKERFPYRKHSITIKKRSSFIGSVNRKEFLNDPTGNRRFLCITAMEINADHNIDMKKVFAQAKHLLLSGETHWFTYEQNKEISLNSLEFSYSTLEEEVIIEKYVPCKHDDDDARFLSTTEINRELFPDHIDNSVRNRIGQALTKLGFIKRNKFINGSSRSVWVIKNKSSISYAIKETEDLPF
ncbi:MAG: hypothetical protein A2279_05315 [Stygiobacter sp. RIFOXYA12_FULL_38_9]|nr:MAG: hypothetical protein A2X62_07320 [Stygiobacter sp. GWC2_38_9]OGU84149.1 MAG: hypothetical protein A2279_05315 [Stygiobacter sp. RIFOXYA12_FULL_38_9]OGV09287.1 MAG: hypothetical protein A2299_15435 [Stygiobacter sp. RIFOXYB2_FULL_37_11]OGV16534.1 MAG: hypothetical protein A2440_02320 [Stygiobacter sp. RIFOXYC2_FULL_38_25]OGV16997.1 MAG: hypothetical protein A2237_01680 [Stygiobacter sp. RIFOXYA2_FULL_38_8]OGV79884.1 MAG: hypothetical protein A2X65_10005 [Stygiobacter sp. GWF2_38_21]